MSIVSTNSVLFVISRKLIVVEMYSIHHHFLILCLRYIDIYRERSLWIIITIFFVFIVLILTWTLNVKRNRCVFEPDTFSVWTKIHSFWILNLLYFTFYLDVIFCFSYILTLYHWLISHLMSLAFYSISSYHLISSLANVKVMPVSVIETRFAQTIYINHLPLCSCWQIVII